jgi:hypothetical protein
MADLMTKIRRALGYVRESVIPGADEDHEAALRRLDEQRIRLGRVDAFLDSNRAATAKAGKH